MLIFPGSAVIRRNMPKEAFYKNLQLSREIRNKFVSDVQRIVMEYKLAPETINIEPGHDVAEILVLSLELKKAALDYRIIENIARQNAHKLLFLIKHGDKGQLAVYMSKLYKTDWMLLADLKLETRGLDLDKVWDGFVEQIALKNIKWGMQNSELSLEEKLRRHEVILRLQKEIDRLERLSRNEKQPKKRFELYTQLQDLKKRLSEEKGE